MAAARPQTNRSFRHGAAWSGAPCCRQDPQPSRRDDFRCRSRLSAPRIFGRGQGSVGSVGRARRRHCSDVWNAQANNSNRWQATRQVHGKTAENRIRPCPESVASMYTSSPAGDFRERSCCKTGFWDAIVSTLNTRLGKPLVGSSILSPGTSKIRHFCNFHGRFHVAACHKRSPLFPAFPKVSRRLHATCSQQRRIIRHGIRSRRKRMAAARQVDCLISPETVA
jgi:hypothetical protein